MHPTILPPAKDKLKTGLFNLGLVTILPPAKGKLKTGLFNLGLLPSQGEGKLWIQAC